MEETGSSLFGGAHEPPRGAPGGLSDRLMQTNPTTSDQSGDACRESSGGAAHRKRWPKRLCLGLCAYYLLSALTLPFVNQWWLGEMAPLALFQSPKGFLKSVIHQGLMSFVTWAGWSRGSHSPDYGATHGWAMGLMASLPLITLIVILLTVRPLPGRSRLIAAAAGCALLDGLITFWFDSASNLKLYNAVFF